MRGMKGQIFFLSIILVSVAFGQTGESCLDSNSTTNKIVEQSYSELAITNYTIPTLHSKLDLTNLNWTSKILYNTTEGGIITEWQQLQLNESSNFAYLVMSSYNATLSLMQQENGGWNSTPIFTSNDEYAFFALGNFDDQTGNQEILISTYPSDSIQILSLKNGMWSPIFQDTLPDKSYILPVVGNIMNSGKQQVILTNVDQGIIRMLSQAQNGSWTYSLVANNTGQIAASSTCYDLDDDNYDEVVSDINGTIYIYEYVISDDMWLQTVFSDSGESGGVLQCGDVTGDGYVDLVVASSLPNNTIQVYSKFPREMNSTVIFQQPFSIARAVFFQMQIADMDSDLLNEILVLSGDSQNEATLNLMDYNNSDWKFRELGVVQMSCPLWFTTGLQTPDNNQSVVFLPSKDASGNYIIEIFTSLLEYIQKDVSKIQTDLFWITLDANKGYVYGLLDEITHIVSYINESIQLNNVWNFTGNVMVFRCLANALDLIMQRYLENSVVTTNEVKTTLDAIRNIEQCIPLLLAMKFNVFSRDDVVSIPNYLAAINNLLEMYITNESFATIKEQYLDISDMYYNLMLAKSFDAKNDVLQNYHQICSQLKQLDSILRSLEKRGTIASIIYNFLNNINEMIENTLISNFWMLTEGNNHFKQFSLQSEAIVEYQEQGDGGSSSFSFDIAIKIKYTDYHLHIEMIFEYVFAPREEEFDPSGVHWWAGAELKTGSITAYRVSETIYVPNYDVPAGEQYAILLSTIDNDVLPGLPYGSYDQIGLVGYNGHWGIGYSWSDGDLALSSSYHSNWYVGNIELKKNFGYTFLMEADGYGDIWFRVTQASLGDVWEKSIGYLGTHFILNPTYYTLYEEVYNTIDASPPFAFRFYNSKYVTMDSVTHVPTWNSFQSATAPTGVEVGINEGDVTIYNLISCIPMASTIPANMGYNYASSISITIYNPTSSARNIKFSGLFSNNVKVGVSQSSIKAVINVYLKANNNIANFTTTLSM